MTKDDAVRTVHLLVPAGQVTFCKTHPAKIDLPYEKKIVFLKGMQRCERCRTAYLEYISDKCKHFQTEYDEALMTEKRMERYETNAFSSKNHSHTFWAVWDRENNCAWDVQEEYLQLYTTQTRAQQIAYRLNSGEELKPNEVRY
jgi:hypothetical protein